MEGLTIGSVLSGLFATSIVFVLGFASNWMFLKWKYRHFSKVWNQFTSSKTAKVVITIRPGPESSSTPRVSLAEVRAFQSIEQISAKLGLKLDLADSAINPATLSQENLILLGGPKANNVSSHYWSEVEERVPFALSLENQSIESGNKTYTPEQDDSGLLTVDYSLVVKMQRENSSKYLFLFAGCHGFGTSGSTRIVSDASMVRTIAKRVADKEFVAVVRSNIVNGVVDTVEILDIYAIA